MADAPALDLPADGKLGHNITHFARALRKAGLPIGPGRILDAIRAVEAAGFSERTDFYWTLHACFVSRPEHRPVFAQVFRLFWRDPQYLEQMMSLLLPAVRGVQDDRKAAAGEKRAAEALLDGALRDLPEVGDRDLPPEEIEIDARFTLSPQERLRSLDFEQMSTAEMAEARRMLARLTLPVRPLPSRRTVADALGSRPDWRGTLRASLRQGGEIPRLFRKSPRQRWPNLIVICDISGSMAQYSRMVLQFVHAVANRKGQGWARVHAFTFGTRLTNVTRHLRQCDVDAALASMLKDDPNRTNPFLHLSMHLSISEQCSIDQPRGIRQAVELLTHRLNSLHDAHHRAMECLGRMIFESQRSGRMPDGESYIACVQRNATQD
jgi:uncharacterized protein with von Willebrand factor type A (vWA) domain